MGLIQLEWIYRVCQRPSLVAGAADRNISVNCRTYGTRGQAHSPDFSTRGLVSCSCFESISHRRLILLALGQENHHTKSRISGQ